MFTAIVFTRQYSSCCTFHKKNNPYHETALQIVITFILILSCLELTPDIVSDFDYNS